MKYKQETGEYYDTILNYVLIWAYYETLWAWRVHYYRKSGFADAARPVCMWDITQRILVESSSKASGREWM